MLTGDRYFDSKIFQNILMSYENSVKSGHPIFMDADDLTDIADYYNLIGDTEKAKETIDYALEISPDATLPLVFKAREALAKGEHEKAAEYAEQIGDKEDPDYKYLLAELLIAKNETEQAEYLLEDFFMETPLEEREDFILDAANLYIEYGISDKAFGWMCKGKRQNADFKEIMARTLFGLERYEESEKLFNELIDIDPYSKDYWNALANVQLMNEKYEEAITSSEYAIAINPDDADALLTKANALYRTENYKEAIEFYKRYSERMPMDELGEMNIATCLINMDMFGEAIKHLEKAENIAPQNSVYLANIYREMAFSYSAIKMAEKALEYLDKALNKNYDLTDIMVLKGHVLLENGRFEEAKRLFLRALIYSERSPKVALRIIVSLYDNKYQELAYKMFKVLFDKVGESFNEGYSYMALCCWDLRLLDDFLKYLKLAIQINPSEAKKVLRHLFPNSMEPKEYYNYIISRLNSD